MIDPARVKGWWASRGAEALARALYRPEDIASLVAFRVAFGLLMFAAAIRFVVKGWVHELYVAPSFHFSYPGFEWVKPLPGWGMYVLFALIAASALLIAIGLWYRVAAGLFFVAFTYVELIDVATYLNHYYLISIVSALLVLLPAERAGSLDARRKPETASQTAPAWCVGALRAQIGLVYLFAGVAKLQADWLCEAEPLRTWLAARADLPLLGPLLLQPATPYLFSWVGALFDLTIPFFLLWRRTRLLAYVAVIVFHGLTGALFRIGIFPWVMIALTPIFFQPDWPRRLLRLRLLSALPPAERSARSVLGARRRALVALLALHFAVQVLLPLRHHLFKGNHLWTNEGFRFAWHVMVAEKSGVATFWLRDRTSGERWMVTPEEHLTPLQAKMMAIQPDLIARFARYLRERYARVGRGPLEVRVDAYASLNGRPSQRLIDPTIDLGAPEGDRPYVVDLSTVHRGGAARSRAE